MAPTAKISHFDEKEKATRGACPRRRGGRGGWSLLAVPDAPARWPVCSEAERPELTTPLHSTRMTEWRTCAWSKPPSAEVSWRTAVYWPLGKKAGADSAPPQKVPCHSASLGDTRHFPSRANEREARQICTLTDCTCCVSWC